MAFRFGGKWNSSEKRFGLERTLSNYRTSRIGLGRIVVLDHESIPFSGPSRGTQRGNHFRDPMVGRGVSEPALLAVAVVGLVDQHHLALFSHLVAALPGIRKKIFARRDERF